MTGAGAKRALPVLVAAAVLAVVGCSGAVGSSGPSGSAAAPSAAAASPAAATSGGYPLSAATSVATAGESWATLPMGGTGENEFWQLFGRSAAGGTWSLHTPPDVATNGALILAPQPESQAQRGGGQAGAGLLVGIRPSIDLSFSPVTRLSDDKDWSTLSPAAGLADVPGALATAPGGQLTALGTGQQVSTLASADGQWSALTSEHTLAATPAGRSCGLTELTAVATAAGSSPAAALLGGTCGQPGVAGIFAEAGGQWRLAGPRLAGSLAGDRVQVLRLARTGSTDTALLEAGGGSSAVLLAAWTAGAGGAWTVSAPLALSGASPSSASLGASGAIGVVAGGRRAELIAGPGSAWRQLPPLPAARSAILALSSSSVPEALTATGGTLDVWRLSAPSGRWDRVQVIQVPVQYGSSD